MKIYKVIEDWKYINYKSVDEDVFNTKHSSIYRGCGAEFYFISEELANEKLNCILSQFELDMDESIEKNSQKYYIKYIWENGQPYKLIKWSNIEIIEINE